ncbi:MAG TPA: TetR/AcrR family transcriptional regulator [Polyangiaceae bacterium]|nr:TetR/AcrR family transcriptional regulator [Polyangiaceae bacterium]
MPRPTARDPQRGDARTRLLDAARDRIRAQGYAATTVDDLCREAGVTKGAFFHHFESKEALGVAVAKQWTEATTALFAAAPYHAPADPLQRVMAYIEYRKQLVTGSFCQFTCLGGTLLQEVYESSPAMRDACAESILGHAATLEADIAAAMRAHAIEGNWTAESLARHTQTVIQGSFVMAKATGDPETAREALDHLARYVELLFSPRAGKHDSA